MGTVRPPKPPRGEDGPTEIDEWSAGPWTSDILRPEHGWHETGKRDNCGCPIWWLEEHADRKSATAHEDGCSKVDTSYGHGPLHLWTDAPPEFLHGKGSNFTKLQYLAHAQHGGDLRAAMQAVGMGYTATASAGEGPSVLEFIGTDTDIPERSSDLVLPDSFWESTEFLRYLRRLAHTRGISADGLLFTLLAWTSAIVPHTCRLDTGMVSDDGASLNLFAARTGSSGAGKSASSASTVRKLLRPHGTLMEEMDLGKESEEQPLGSG